jgi:hypothetical protein
MRIRALGSAPAADAQTFAWLPLTLALILSACGGGTPEARRADRPLPSYGGHAVELFDDGIEPAGVGFQLGGQAEPGHNAPRSDNLLRERTQVGDAVVRARVTTVTAKDEDRGRSWQLGLHTLERLGGTGPLEPDFMLRVGASDTAAGIVRAFEARLIGTTFVAFVREFGRPGGETELHFHLAQDAKEEVDAVKSAVLLDQVR